MLRARHARNQAHEFDPMAAEVLVAPSPFAAPVVVFGALAPATRPTQRAPPAPHPDHQDGSRAQRRVVDGHVLDDHALDVQQSFELALQPRRFPRLYFLVEKQTYRKRPSHIGIQRLTDEPPPTKTTQEPKKAGRKRPRHLEAFLTENQLPYTICCLKIQGSSKRFRTSAESQSPSANS